ncbi:MAG: DNA starvation/stationary phase protection protein [Luteolibacter sp.]
MTKKSTPKVSIGISAASRKKIQGMLSEILSDQHVLYIKTRNFHWNLIGGRFHSLHLYFEDMYDELALAIDETAERIRMIGGTAPGSMAEFIKSASLKETKGAPITGEDAIKALLGDHETVCTSLRKHIPKIGDMDDLGTEDFLVGLLQKHEKTAWMLRSYLEG